MEQSGISWIEAADVPIDIDGPEIEYSPFDPVAGPERPILGQIAERAELWPDQLAVRDDTRGLTYRALLSEANALAAAIAAVATPGQPVGIRLEDTASGPLAFLACLAAATPGVLLDCNDPPERLARIASVSRMAAIITDKELPGYRNISPLGHAPVPFVPRPLAQHAPAFVVWTSGSSGQPKGIVHSQSSVLHRAGLLVNSGHLGPADRYLSLNTPASMGALLNAIAAWLAGATLHRVSVAQNGLGGILQRIRENRITAMIGVPALYRMLARAGGAKASLSSLRLLSSNGEALLAADLALLRACLPDSCKIQMVYGATETQAAMRFVPKDEMPAEAQVAAGRPIPGTQFVILREDGSAAALGETGELVIRSRYTAIGEWQDGQCVEGRLLPDGEPGWRRYAMGDLVRQREDGVLLVVGRADRQLKLNGYRVEPVEIEAVLRSDADVLDSAVLPVTGPMGAELVAFVSVEPAGEAALRPRLMALLATRIPAHMRPRRLHLLPSLPLLPGNKIDAAALRAHDAGLPGRV